MDPEAELMKWNMIRIIYRMNIEACGSPDETGAFACGKIIVFEKGLDIREKTFYTIVPDVRKRR